MIMKTKDYLLSVLAVFSVVLYFACSTGTQEETTESEPEFVSLFNGTDLSGWVWATQKATKWKRVPSLLTQMEVEVEETSIPKKNTATLFFALNS